MKRKITKQANKLKKKLIGCLPQNWRHRIIRSQLHLEYDLPNDVVFKIAETEDELNGAFEILHDAYVEMGYMQPHPSGKRITYYHLLPSTTTLVGKIKNEVIATVSIIRNSSQGLPLESDFDLSSLKKENTTIAEISSLVVRKDFRKNNGQVLFPLLKFSWLYCRFYFGVDYMVLATNPKQVELFDAITLFSPLEDKVVPNYGFANGAPAVARFLDLRSAPINYALKYGTKNKNKNLFFFMMPKLMGGVDFSYIKLPDRKDFRISDPVITPDLLKKILSENEHLIKYLTPQKALTLLSHYNKEEFKKQIPELHELEKNLWLDKRQACPSRHEVRCDALLKKGLSKEDELPALIKDISLNGLGGHSSYKLEPNQIYSLKIAVAPLNVIRLSARVSWQDEQGNFGLHILRHKNEWASFIKSLEPSRKIA